MGAAQKHEYIEQVLAQDVNKQIVIRKYAAMTMYLEQIFEGGRWHNVTEAKLDTQQELLINKVWEALSDANHTG